jgi:hypothetical protein
LETFANRYWGAVSGPGPSLSASRCTISGITTGVDGPTSFLEQEIKIPGHKKKHKKPEHNKHIYFFAIKFYLVFSEICYRSYAAKIVNY